MLTLAPGCSPRRLRPAMAALRLPSRTVAQGPTCGAQVAPDQCADQRMTMPSEMMTPDQADLRVVAAELTGVNACIPSRQPPAHALRTVATGKRMGHATRVWLNRCRMLKPSRRPQRVVRGRCGCPTAVIGRCSGGRDAGSPAYEGVEGAVGQQPVQEDHGFGAVADGVTTPGRIVFAEIRYSAATVNSNPGESCSIARSSRNCSRSFITALSAGAALPPQIPGRQPHMIQPGVRALPIPRQHRRIQPRPLRQPGHRRRPGSRNATSAGVNVKYQIIPADVGERPQPLQLILSKHPAGTGPRRNRQRLRIVAAITGTRPPNPRYRKSGISDKISAATTGTLESADQGAGQQTGGTGPGIYGREPTPELRL